MPILEFEPLSELLASPPPPVRSLWGEGMLMEKSLTMLHGPSKLGKSMITTNLAIAGARGDTEFLGVPMRGPFSTLIFQGEIHRRGMWERFDTMLRLLAGGLTEEQCARIVLNKSRGVRLNNEAAFIEFWEYIKGMRPDLVVLDPLAHVLTANENDNAVVGALLERLAVLRDDPGCSILLVHHDSKPSESSNYRSPHQRSRGADRLNADPDAIISMVPQPRQPTGPASKLHVASRYGRSIEPIAARLNESTLWFEKYVERGDVTQVGVWVSESEGAISHDALVERIEKGWNLADSRHRAAERYIAEAVERELISESVNERGKWYAVRT